MVKLNKIYTRTGDAGTTGLGTGERVAKHDLRISAYGTVDETNACLGLVRQHTASEDAALDAKLERIQNDLFDLGADLCVPDRGAELGYEPLRVTQAQVDWLETEIDAMNSELAPLKSFVLPGGTAAAAALHLARTVSRRAERDMTALAATPDEPVSASALKYINRLSDYLFVASRYVNRPANGDILWVPGKNR
jgi:cob(I)alamin adenosyltransferase